MSQDGLARLSVGQGTQGSVNRIEFTMLLASVSPCGRAVKVTVLACPMLVPVR